MGGTISALLDVSKRALFAQQQAISVIGNNIANVNTEGYSRRKGELQEVVGSTTANSGAQFGSGVELTRVVRIVDKFLNEEFIQRIEDKSFAEIKNEFLSRAEAPFALDGASTTIGDELQNFFSTIEDLAVNPADLSLRSAVINAGQNLSDVVNSTYNTLAGLQREADDRLAGLVQDINRISQEVAELNRQIIGSEGRNQENLTIRDQRDQLLRELAENISFDTIENTDGTTTVTLENGFALVIGTNARTIEFTPAPDFAPVPNGFPPGMDGVSLGHIVYDFDPTSAGTSHVDLTSILASGGGEVAGLLTLRGVQSTTDTSAFDAVGDLVELGTRVELIARDLLGQFGRFNTTYSGPDEDGTNAIFQASAGDLSGAPPSVFGLFTATGLTDSPTAGIVGLAESSDFDPRASYAGSLRFTETDPARLAAGRDQDAVQGSIFVPQGDFSNFQAILNDRNSAITYTLGNFTQTSTIDELYNNAVSTAGGLQNRAGNDLFVASDRELQMREFQASVSAVNVDEEFAQLINFQRAFEASARMIGIGDQLLQEVIALVS